MKLNEWKIALPSGQCPYADFVFNSTKKETDILCKVREANSGTDINCSENKCPLRVEKTVLFKGLYLSNVEGEC